MHNIRTRTLAATALLMLLAVATGVLGLSGAASLHGSFDELGQRSVPAQLLLLNIDRDAYQAQLALEQALFAPDAETRDAAVADWEENFAQVAERFAGYEDVSVGAEGEAERWPEFEAAQAAWGDAAEQLLASTPVGKPVPAEALASERALFGVARDMVDAIGGDIYEQIIPEATAEVTDKDSSLRLQLTIAVLACLVLGAIVLVIVGRGLRPLDSLVGSAQQIAEGDPDVTLSVKADQSEVGRLTDAFQRLTVYVQDVAGSLDKMAHGDLSTVPTTRGDRDALGQSMQTLSLSLREVVGRIRDAVGQLTGSSHQLVSMSEHLASSAADTSYQASAAAAAGQQMHASIREVAHNASEAVNVSARAVDLAGAASVVVSRLEQSSGEIGAVLEVISSIAAQTNLLALNATIEAARAGEAGRGFAVVADEVKHLATQTTDATEGVRARVAAIQADTAQAIVSISSVAEIISTISEHMHGIASAVEEQEATTNEIARSIEGVVGTADSTRSVTDAAGVTAAELERLAAHLDEVIGRFTGV